MVRSRALLAVVCVALVLLSGCSALDTGSDGTATVNGTETVTNGTETPDESDTTNESLDELPPGVSDDGVDVDALLSAHAAAVDDDGAVTVTNLTVDGQSGTIQSNATVRMGADGTVSVRTVNAVGGRTTEVDQYTNGTVSAVRQQTPRVDRQTAFDAGGYIERRAGIEGLRLYVELGAFELSERGSETVTLTADDVDPDAVGEDRNLGADVESYEGTLVVDEAGRIVSFQATVETSSGGSESTIGVDYEITDVGVESVERPAWVDETLARETIAQLTYERTGGTVAITNDGDEAIPEGTSVTVSATAGVGNDQYVVQLTESLDPGETAYVYRTTADATQGAVSVGEQPDEDAVPIEGDVQVVVSGQGGVVDAETLPGDGDDEGDT